MSQNNKHRVRRIDRRNLLKFGGGAVATAVGLPVLSSPVAAHFPNNLTIDIKPDSDRNSVNPRSNGIISVAVLQTDEFDPTCEDIRYRFGAPATVTDGFGAQPAHGGHVTDVNGDGNDDLLLHFPIEDTGFDAEDEQGRLEWERSDEGEHGLAGTDSVTIVGCGH